RREKLALQTLTATRPPRLEAILHPRPVIPLRKTCFLGATSKGHWRLWQRDSAAALRPLWRSSFPTRERRHPVFRDAPREHRSVSTLQRSQLYFQKRAAPECQVSCAPRLQTSLFDAQLLASPRCALRRRQRLRCVESPPRWLLLSQSGMHLFHLSILRACRRTAPSNNH